MHNSSQGITSSPAPTIVSCESRCLPPLNHGLLPLAHSMAQNSYPISETRRESTFIPPSRMSTESVSLSPRFERFALIFFSRALFFFF